FARDESIDIAGDASQKRHLLGRFIQALRRLKVAELLLQRSGRITGAVPFTLHLLHLVHFTVGAIISNGHGAVGSQTGTPMKAYQGAITRIPYAIAISTATHPTFA